MYWFIFILSIFNVNVVYACVPDSLFGDERDKYISKIAAKFEEEDVKDRETQSKVIFTPLPEGMVQTVNNLEARIGVTKKFTTSM